MEENAPNESNHKFDVYTIFLMIILILVISGIFGFIYETIFYRIDLGYFVKRGETIGPWLPLYALGGICVSAVTFKARKKPVLVFLISTIVCGALEYITGYYLLYNKGIRLWDYNVEIWNWGNIDGFVCIRSVLAFGLFSLILMYVVIPLVSKLAKKTNKIMLSIIALIPGILFLADYIANYVIK